MPSKPILKLLFSAISGAGWGTTRQDIGCHQKFDTLKTDIHQEIAELGQKFDGMEKRVDDLSTAVARLELISDLLKK